jgi:hypothetical protein
LKCSSKNNFIVWLSVISLASDCIRRGEIHVNFTLKSEENRTLGRLSGKREVNIKIYHKANCIRIGTGFTRWIAFVKTVLKLLVLYSTEDR